MIARVFVDMKTKNAADKYLSAALIYRSVYEIKKTIDQVISDTLLFEMLAT